MLAKYLLSLACLACTAPVQAQNPDSTRFDRSQLTLMVVPQMGATDNGYTAAIAELNNALLDKGYRNTLDEATRQHNVTDQRIFTSAIARSDSMKIFIEEAPADIRIEAEMHWMEQPAGDAARQLQISLKAVDNYTGALYAQGIIQSKPRQFPGMEKAVQNTLKLDGKEAFEKFVARLDQSYARVIKEGRLLNLQFEVDYAGEVRLTDRIEGERITEKIETYIKQKAFKGQYRITGESPAYMGITALVPVVDERGIAVSPGSFLARGLDNYFYALGLEVMYASKVNLYKFVLKKRSSSPNKGTAPF